MNHDIKNGKLIDMHCHVDLFRYPGRIVRECDQLEIRTIAVTTTPKAWPGNNRIMKESQFVRPALGYHPELVQQRHKALPLFMEYLPEARYVGEIGLDGRGSNRSGLDEQIQVLTKILMACSSQGYKVLSLHGAGAWPKLIDLLEEYLDISTCRIILHWFTGSKKQVSRAIHLNSFFSLNVMQFNSANLRGVLSHLPADRVLTETDGPFIKMGEVPSTPKDVSLVIERCAKMWGTSKAKASQQVIDNLRELTTLFKGEQQRAPIRP